MKKESLSGTMAKLIMAVVLIVGIGALLGALGYFGTMPKSEVVINNEVEKEIMIQDETANWKTYRSEEYGFEVKYPEEYVIKKEEELTQFALGILFEDMNIYQTLFDTQIDYDNNFGMGNFYISVIDNPNKLSLSKWFEENNIPKFGTKNAILSEIDDKEIVIDNVYGVDRIISGGGGNLREIVLLKDDKIIILGIDSSNTHPNYRDDSDSQNKYIDGKEKIEEFNQILSSFKFIEKEIN